MITGNGIPSNTCGAARVCPVEVVPVGTPLSKLDGATRGNGVVVALVTPARDGPTLFVATTENLYGTPFVNPVVISHVVAPGAGVQVTAGLKGTPFWSKAVTR